MLQLSVGEHRPVMQYTDFWSFFVVPVLSLIILIPTAICLQKEGVKVFSEILKKSCSALACFYSIRHFIMFILCYCVAVVVEILILLFKLSMDYRQNLQGTLLYACIFIGKFYIYSFLYHFGVAVMSNTTASWHYSQDNEEISSKSVWKSIKIVCRFHLGRVAFGASVIPPYFLAIYSPCRHTATKRSGNTVVAQIFKLVSISEITNFAVIQISVHGYNFVKSTKRLFDLMVKNYSINGSNQAV
ncbi:choline transporter-like protein 2 [Nasonia vitripennis]|uniref:Choline transporter-like protein n=1 Tax=Nasonia vitripennis TaxID=7425 RepID=A0A7M7Q0W0_NASVI|nr:choline transporter-like protein 2 [Nasonia vitripennis]